MSRSIDFAFTLLSPWTYLGFDRFHAIVRTHDLDIRYRPVNLGEVFKETGGLPLAQRAPARQRYRLMELQRWRAARGLPLVISPKGFPCNIALADKTALAIAEAGASPEEFCRKVLRGIWVENRQMDDEGELRAALAAAGNSPDVLEAAKSEAIASIYASNRDWAIANGVFGAPSFVIDGEIFWGQDRLEHLDDMLSSGRKAYRADPNA
jgi:2-hydroxychromene-2-carboxylate isomerase